jgi:deazaflavin-dependent oxidoreductase (nitroreductase family)
LASTRLPPDLAALDVCDLETIGRASGLPRLVEIWFAAAGDRLYLLSGGRDNAHWVRNVQANPAIRLHFGERAFEGRATVIEGEPDEDFARRALATKYQGWSEGRRLSGWARNSLPVAIDVVAEEAS